MKILMKITHPLLLFFKLSKYFLWLSIAISITLGMVIFFYSICAKSVPNGKFYNQNIRDHLTIKFDESDVPHIQAQYPNDAYFALGYLHARERTWQMEFNRRLASGTLSEVLGDKTIDIDSATIYQDEVGQFVADAINEKMRILNCNHDFGYSVNALICKICKQVEL